jgi:hypothetical protein
MNATLILWPVLVQISLTIVIFLLLAVAKRKAIKAGGFDRGKTALHNDAWPDAVLKVSNNLQNQFQTPVLFYALSFAFLNLGTVSITVLALAWGYAIMRIGHAYVHVTSNYVPMRFRLFVLGFVMLTVMTVILAKQMVFGLNP